MKERLVNAISDMQEDEAIRVAREMLDSGNDPQEILDASREAMAIVGNRYERKEYFLPELIIAGDILKEIGAMVRPRLKAGGGGKTLGKVLLGTVAGDIHDIGKDIVVSLLKAANYDVRDLGVDVPPQKVVDAVKETGATVVGLSGLLTIAFDSMKETVAALATAGLRSKVKVMIGGGFVSETVQHYAGADAWGMDAQAAVSLCNQWIKEVAK